MTQAIGPQVLMVQGTTSDAGKSVLAAGICRVLARRGISVAPMKPQNMALNSAVTVDGGEIGRSQALQAIACGIEPHTDMNPILLKPASDTGAQVIVQGKAITNMNAKAYHGFKAQAMDYVLASLARLKQQYQVIVVEGAGSPAEINLREHDIANMGFAEAADCPVIIVADIDKGGVFAHLVGTLDLLSASEQARVQGFVINRFRGDMALLQPGIDWLEARTAKPVLGVIPFIHGLYLEAEDALSASQTAANQTVLEVVVPVFSRISNHTDFDALRMNPSVNVTFVRKEQSIPACDLIILPGSKNVRADLRLLREQGWDKAIQRHLRYGGKLLGICGGYQMLGDVVKDPQGVEETAGSEQGLGLLPLTTMMSEQKALENSQGVITGSQTVVKGYEIHCGVTDTLGLTSFATLSDGRSDGVISDDGKIIGTYLHGLFDTKDAANWLLNWAGLTEATAMCMAENREYQLNRLADTLEAHLDFKQLGYALQPAQGCSQ